VSKLTILNDPKFPGSITFEPTYATDCTIGKVPFHGKITIVYEPNEVLLEFEAFEDWLKDKTSRKSHTVESLCHEIFESLQAILAPEYLEVTVHAHTIVHSDVCAQIIYAKNP